MRGARIAVETCMGVKAGEKVLIVTDTGKLRIAEALMAAAHSLGAEALMMVYTPRRMHGEEPPPPVAAAMKAADVVLAPTTYSITHTKARKEASDLGVRIASMPTITEEMFTRGPMTADYWKIKEVSERLAEKFSRAREAELTSPKGTSLTFKLGRQGIADTGILHGKGAFGNLPAGEAFTAPLEDETEGVAVVDGSVAGVGLLSTPIRLEIRRGKVEKIEGGVEARRLEMLLRGADQGAWRIAELGIGTNPQARVVGNVLEDEKAMGTAHIALGNNLFIGGKIESKVHLDAVILNPTVKLDGEAVIENGELKV